MISRTWRDSLYLIVFSLAFFQIGVVFADENDLGTLTIGNMGAISGLDPAVEGSRLVEEALIVETLVAIDQEYNLNPWLATSWDQIDDTTWEFKLRDDVLFHDGSKMTASDVKFSLQRAADLDGTVKGLLKLDSIDAVDETTLRIHTTEPNSILPVALHYYNAGIMSPKSLDDKGEVTAPIGTGPFRFESYDPQTQVLTAVRNDKWWGGKPKLDKVVIKPLTDPNTRVLALENGEVDFTMEIPYNEVDRISSQSEFTVEQFPSCYIYRVDLNSKRSALSDIRVRQALSYATNREDIVKYVLFGIGASSKGPFNPEMPWTNNSIEPYSFDIEKAKELLAEAGWKDENGDGILDKDGKPLKLSLITYSTRSTLPDIAESLAGQYKNIGALVETEIMEWGAITDRRESGDWDMVLMATNTAMIPDPYYYLERSYGTGGAYNYVKYSNPVVDSILNETLVVEDRDERYQMFKDLQAITWDEVMNIVIAHSNMLVVHDANIKGFEFDPTAHDYRLNANVYKEG
jgi:peptide/nickel transport system substrate-binding protein